MTASLHTSTQFACVIADGADWREVGRKLLEKIESIRTPDDGMNIGFVYMTDDLASECASLVSLLKNITRISSWFGAMGAGICGNGISLTGRPAAVVMIGRLPENSFHDFTLPADFSRAMPDHLREWTAGRQPVMALTHGLLCAPAARALDMLRDRLGLYSVGGFSSSRTGGLHITSAALATDDPVSGVVLDDSLQVVVAVSQGCVPAGPAHEVTGIDGNTITEIDHRPAMDVLHDCIDLIKLEPTGENPPQRKGHIHAAFPVSGVDTGALMVRNITEADEDGRTLTVAHNISKGDAIQFVYRDRHTALEDLTVAFKNLHTRARHAVGDANLKPKALLYFGCSARMPDAEHENSDEAVLARTIFGDIPMAGFYTAAEICNGHVYGYTGIAVLIL